MFDLTVNHAQKIQRDVELDHEGVDHHQITQRHAAFGYALGGAPQHGHQRYRNDELLPGVEQAERGLAFDRSPAKTLQVMVVALGLELFVVEVFNGLEVQQ